MSAPDHRRGRQRPETSDGSPRRRAHAPREDQRPRRPPTSDRWDELDVARKVDALGIDPHPDRVPLTRYQRHLLTAVAVATAGVYLWAVTWGTYALGWWH